MRERLKRLIPTREQILANRWLRWATPFLHHPKLWHWSRRSVALGVALGIFFGLLIPVAQIPLSVGAAILLRANLPAAAVSTLITNPVTFGPIYYLAYKTGALILNEPVKEVEEQTLLVKLDNERDASLLARIGALGRPLLLGLAIFASLGGIITYLLISLIWRLWIWRKRLKSRTNK